MTLGEHLEELRRRVIYALAGLACAMILCLAFGRQILKLIEHPYRAAIEGVGGIKPDLVLLSVTEAFSVYLRVAFYAGLVLASPWIFYQLWTFVAAGLYPREKRYITLTIPVSVLLFLAGGAFGVCVSIPAIQFFVGFGTGLGQQNTTLSDYMDFMTQLMLVCGVIFQMPLVVLALAKVGLVSMRTLNRYRRHVIVGIGAFAAVFAPPDVLSMLVMMLPMWLLYELGILLAWLLVLRKKAASPLP